MKKLTVLFGIAALLSAAALVFVACGGPSAAAQLRLEITAPSGRTVTVSVPTQMISGIVSDAAGVVTVNDMQVAVNEDGSFSHDVELAYGTNRIVVAATIEGRDRPITRTINVNRTLNLTLLSPEGIEIDADTPVVTGENTIMISGRVSDPQARVLVTGDEVAVDEDGNFSSLVDLYYTLTTLNVTAMIDAVETPLTTLVTVHRTP